MNKRLVIGTGIGIFIIIVAVIFFISYKLGQKTSVTPSQQLIDSSRQTKTAEQQIRRIKFTKTTGESTEIFMDGSVKQYDKSGKLIKTGRRGFAETQQILRQFEWLLNNGKSIGNRDYQIEIETQTGTTTIQPGTGDSGGSAIDDALDFIDKTINPTPTPRPSPSTVGATPTPLPTSHPSPTPLPEAPDYLSAPPFDCADYYTGGKALKISNIICGPTSTP